MKYRAVHDYLTKHRPTSEICASLGISSRTLRRWAKRYRVEGYIGLLPRSRAPKRIHNKLPEEDELLIIDAKLRNPSAGARRLSYILFDETGREFNYRTVHRVLKRNGLSVIPLLSGRKNPASVSRGDTPTLCGRCSATSSGFEE